MGGGGTGPGGRDVQSQNWAEVLKDGDGVTGVKPGLGETQGGGQVERKSL